MAAGLILLLVLALLTGGMGGMGQMISGTVGLVLMFTSAGLLIPAIVLVIVLLLGRRENGPRE